MKAKWFFFTYWLAYSLNAKAQYEAANWPMLYHNLVLKITPGTFERDSLSYGTYATFMADASISDEGGYLKMFSYAYDVRNNLGEVIEGGCCLYDCYQRPDYCQTGAGSPHLQGALILPRPGSSTQYYLFIRDKDSLFQDGAVQPMRVTATLVDMSYNNGAGKVIQQPTSILEPVSALSDSRMTALRHANGRDWWLVNHQYLTNTIYTNLITPDSIYGPFEQMIGGNGAEPDNTGWSIFSPDGSIFTTVTSGMRGITILDFDRCNGTFSNYRLIAYDSSAEYFSNLAFSPNGRFLYAGNFTNIMQFDLQDSNMAQSGVLLVHDTADIPLLSSMALALDDKIYIVNWEAEDSFMSVIDSPDLKAPACNFHLRNIYVRSSVLLGIVPNFPNYNLGPSPGSGCDTLNTNLIPLITQSSVRVFPNPSSDIVNVESNINSNAPATLEVTNILGQTACNKLLPVKDCIQQLDVSYFSAGLYTVSIKINNAVIASNKLVILH